MKYLISIIIITLAISSCKKEAVHKFDTEFVGTWYHMENNNEFWYLDISEKSYGSITLYDSLNNHIPRYGENPKRWRIKNSKNILYFGLYTKRFHIDKYPEKAQQQIINGLDTIFPGETYMILDGDYFVN